MGPRSVGSQERSRRATCRKPLGAVGAEATPGSGRACLRSRWLAAGRAAGCRAVEAQQRAGRAWWRGWDDGAGARDRTASAGGSAGERACGAPQARPPTGSPPARWQRSARRRVAARRQTTAQSARRAVTRVARKVEPKGGTRPGQPGGDAPSEARTVLGRPAWDPVPLAATRTHDARRARHRPAVRAAAAGSGRHALGHDGEAPARRLPHEPPTGSGARRGPEGVKQGACLRVKGGTRLRSGCRWKRGTASRRRPSGAGAGEAQAGGSRKGSPGEHRARRGRQRRRCATDSRAEQGLEVGRRQPERRGGRGSR
jgi:hypothetical protein